MNMADTSPEIMAAAIAEQDYGKILALLSAGYDQSVTDSLWGWPYLWSLQDTGDTPEENSIRLKIAQELLKREESPTLAVDGEALLDSVCQSLFNDCLEHEDMEYARRFIILLIAYGGSTDYCSPKIHRPFDLDALDQYHFLLFLEPDRHHLHGEIWDEENNVIVVV